ncbi:MAG: hypothetical protein U1D96_09225 [Eubacteriales bacterium]|nr:hypothetical protein [Bacillota bacterium]MBV1727463.1 hypothetical protein [Desulforudis sp.]MDQ7789804.1 hypothetical protein [Clostridia bacterium]MDZ4043646.1 hypothetical protein [Eubacteriales bacterium]MBU4532937.1 hypothetical protein [Bacillota bacterium]
MLEIKDEMPKVEKVVFYDDKGMKNYRDLRPAGEKPRLLALGSGHGIGRFCPR